MPTQSDLENALTVTLTDITAIDASIISQPSPEDVSEVVLSKTLTPDAVNSTEVSFTSGHNNVTTGDKITTETLNRAYTDAHAEIESLRQNITSALSALATSATSSVSDISVDVTAAISELNSKVDTVVSGINTAFENIRTRDIEQTEEIVSAVNNKLATVTVNLNAIKSVVEDAESKIAALDDVYGTDADIASKISAINALIANLDTSGVSLITAVQSIVTEVNAIRRVYSKTITMSSTTGSYDFNLVGEGFDEYDAASDYDVVLSSAGNIFVNPMVTNKTASGFRIDIRTFGVHFVPQPHNGALTPVDVVVRISSDKQDPLTVNLDAVNSSSVVSSGGTDTNA